jgi:hypothetical protein
MKTRLSIVMLVVAVALMAATGASAAKTAVHAKQRAAYHSLVKSAHKSIDRRSVRGGF